MTHIEELEKRINDLEKRLAEFEPVVVDLRIDGMVRPVTLFAIDGKPRFPKETFRIV